MKRPGPADDLDWQRMRQQLAERLGESMFEIWLEPIVLRAVDRDDTMILVAPQEMRAWVDQRYRSVIDGAARMAGRRARIADAVESAAIVKAQPAVSSPEAPPRGTTAHPSASTSADTSYDTSACALSYTPAYDQPKEVRQC